MVTSVYGVYNIPHSFDSFSLREFFCDFIKENCFQLFHFKNRPAPSFKKVVSTNFPSVSLCACKCNSIPSTRVAHPSFNYLTRAVDAVTVEDTKCVCTTKSCFVISSSDMVKVYDGVPWNTCDPSLGNCSVVLLSKGV